MVTVPGHSPATQGSSSIGFVSVWLFETIEKPDITWVGSIKIRLCENLRSGKLAAHPCYLKSVLECPDLIVKYFFNKWPGHEEDAVPLLEGLFFPRKTARRSPN